MEGQLLTSTYSAIQDAILVTCLSVSGVPFAAALDGKHTCLSHPLSLSNNHSSKGGLFRCYDADMALPAMQCAYGCCCAGTLRCNGKCVLLGVLSMLLLQLDLGCVNVWLSLGMLMCLWLVLAMTH